MRRTLLLIPLLGVWAGCNSDDAFCERYVECREKEDDLDDDALAVCKEQLKVDRDVLAANKGESCKKLQGYKDAWRGCMAAIEDCDDFSDELAKPDECEDEREDLDDYTEDAGAKCYVIPGPLPEGVDTE